MTVVNNVVRPPQTQDLLTTSNNTAKKLWNKRMQMLPIGNNVDIIIQNMTKDIKENIRLMTTNESQTNPPYSPPSSL